MRPLFSIALLLLVRGAGACPVCFGGADGKSGFALGIWWAIVILLAVTMTLVAAIGWAVWSVERGRRERDV